MCRRDLDQSLASSRGRSKKGDPEEPEDHALGLSRGGYGTKIHLVTDGKGLPLAAVITAGQVNECTQFERVLDAVHVPADGPGQPRSRPDAVAGDKGYSYRRIRHWLHRRKIEPVISQRSNQIGRAGGHRGMNKAKYRRRNVVERCVGWLKECRRLATRFEKLALNYLGMVDLAIIQRLLRVLQL